MSAKWTPHLIAWIAICAVLGLVHHRTFSELARLWFDTESYAHGVMVPFISAWLIWRLKGQVTRDIKPAFWWLGALGLTASALLWFVGEMLQVSSFRHFAVVLMLIASIAACFGADLLRALFFPIVFLLFAVPVGDFLIEPMMNHTADVAVMALQWTGIPVYREARSIQIPTGRWAVVEACAGTRYLIASIMLGALYSYLFYRSWMRRLIFMAVAIIVPIVANWLRAYLIIMAGHLSQNKYGVGADHILFGWVFFGGFIFAMFSIGARWREDTPERPQFNTVSRLEQIKPTRALAALAIATGFAAALPHIASMLSPQGQPIVVAEYATKPHWPVDVRELWKPEFSGERGRLSVSYKTKNEVSVSAYRAVYEAQRGENRMLRYGNQFFPDLDIASAKIQSKVIEVSLSGKVISVLENRIPERVGTRVIRSYYQVGPDDTASAYVAKLRLAAQLLRGRGDRSTVVVWSAYAIDESKSLATIAEFEKEFGDQLTRREP